MEKAFCSVVKFDNGGENNSIRMIYEVVLHRDGEVPFSYGCDMPFDLTESIDEHRSRLMEKVAADAAYRGYKLTLGDVIPSGLPMAKDAASATDKSQGITSDKDATTVVETPIEMRPVGLMASLRDRFTSMWG